MKLWPSSSIPAQIDPQGRRLLGRLLHDNELAWGPEGHSSVYAASGGGKTTRAAMPALFSWAASQPEKGILVTDCKSGEIAIQCAAAFEQLGRNVAVIDDMNVWPELAPYRISVNPCDSIVATYKRDRQDVVFVLDAFTESLIPEPADGDMKNKHFRDIPRDVISVAVKILLERAPDHMTPGAVVDLISDPGHFVAVLDIESREGSDFIRTDVRSLLAEEKSENWPGHLSEARRALRLFARGNRLHTAGENATHSYEELIRHGYIVFLIGDQAFLPYCGAYYASHLLSATNAAFRRAGHLRVLADEFTNFPAKKLIEQTTILRSFNVQLMTLIQSRTEVLRKFGENEAETLEENSILKQWLSISSFKEADRLSKAMGEEFSVSETLGYDSDALKTSSNLNLVKQPVLTPAQLMALPRDIALNHIMGVGFFLTRLVSQNEIAPYCHLLAPNPLEGGRLPPDPKITLVTPKGRL